MSTRRVSYRQAVACEQGTGKRCRCRCKKTLHGKKRFGKSPTRDTFEALPEYDPHKISMPRWRRNRDLFADETPHARSKTSAYADS